MDMIIFWIQLLFSFLSADLIY